MTRNKFEVTNENVHEKFDSIEVEGYTSHLSDRPMSAKSMQGTYGSNRH